MPDSIFAALALNGALLLTVLLVLDLLRLQPKVPGNVPRRVVAGLALGAIGIGVMLVPLTLRPGLMFDARTIPIALSGLFFGTVPTVIAMAMTAGYRLIQGGIGVVAGTTIILTSGAIGLAWRAWRRGPPRDARWGELYLFGLVVHVVMLLDMTTLPRDAAVQVLRTVGLPVLVLFPPLTTVLGMLLVRRERREENERQLVANEARFRGLFENSHAIMLVIDPSDGTIVDANAAATEFYGWSLDELRSMRIDQINTLTRAEVSAEMQRARASRRASFAFRHRLADGSVHDVEVFSGPIEREGRPLLYSLIIDVEERRRAAEAERTEMEREERERSDRASLERQARLAALNLAEDALQAQRELQAALSRLQLLIEHAPAALAMFDRDMRYTAVSRRYLANFDLVGVELIGRHHYEVFPEIPERFREVHRRALAGETLRSDADQFVRADGRVMWTRWEVRPWYDEQGEIGGMVLFTEDLTEAMRAREQLVKLSQAVEQSPEAIVITDADGTIEYVNDAFVTTSGYPRDVAIGNSPNMLSSGKTPTETYREMWRELTAGRTWRGEFVNRRPDGSEYVEFATISPLIAPDGRTTHYVAVKEDVTEKKRLGNELDAYRHHLEELVEERTEELYAARERAEAANAAKGAFLANISHEIRTPMNAVVGLSHLLLQEDPTPRQRERLRKIDGASRHLLSIVNDVLDLAKIDAGKISARNDDFHLSAVLDNVRSMILESAKEKGVAVEMDGDDVPLWLRGNATLLRQALLNLAGNAVKFTESGTVRLSAKRLSDTEDGFLVRFEVQDTGVGVPPERLADLFDAFEQGDESTTRAYGGTGLGLAITRRLVDLMGGEVGAASEPGRGSRFWFTVRLERGHGIVSDAEPDAAPASPPRFAGSRVLLVEDNAINREVASELLYGAGLDVDAVENGRIAVDRVRDAGADPYDLILMDVQTPELDGLSATRAIRSMPGGGDVPIVAMTANVFESDRQACFDAGMNDFVAKPVDPSTLYATLARFLPSASSAEGRRATSRRGPSTVADRSDGRPVPGSTPPSAPSAAPPSAPPAALQAIDGLDARRGIATFSGEVSPYLELLRRFLSAHRSDARRTRAELSSGDVEAALRRAHGLHGVAATLGATRLADLAKRIDRAIATDDAAMDAAAIGTLLDELDVAFVELTASLSALALDVASDHVEARPVALDPGEALQRLADLLAHHDAAAIALLADHRDALVAGLGSDFEAVQRAMDAFDFEEALALVRPRLGPIGRTDED